MARYSDTLRDQNSRVIAGALVAVRDYAGNSATLTNDDGSPLENPFSSGADGSVVFNTDDGFYDLEYRYGGRLILTDRRVPVGSPEVDPALDALSLSTGASFVGAEDNASGALWTTVQGFIDDIRSGEGSSLLNYTARWTGGRARTQRSKNEDLASVLDFIPTAQHAGILARTQVASSYNPASDIQAAIDAAAAERRALHVPAGRYDVAPAKALTMAPGAMTVALLLRSEMEIVAERGATFRLANNSSTDVTPRHLAFFATNQVLSGITMRGLTIDMNGANNPISPNRGSGTYALFNQAHIMVSGEPVGGDLTTAARADDVWLEGCTFANTAGVSCIIMGQTNTLGTSLGQRWRVIRNRFLNNGLDSIDHSSVYAWAEDVWLHQNAFIQDTQFGPTGGVAAWEVHGANTWATENLVRRFYRGCWISENFTAKTKDTYILNNKFEEMKATGVDFFGRNPLTLPAESTIVQGNIVTLDDNTHSGLDLKSGITITSILEQFDIQVVGNSTYALGDTVGSSGVAIAAPTTGGQLHDRILIDGNMSVETTFGEVIRTNATCGLGDITVRNNRRFNLTPAGAFAAPTGLSVTPTAGTNQVDHLIIGGNQCIDKRGGSSVCQYGTYLSGAIGTLSRSPEVTRGMTVSGYTEASLTVTARQGTYEATGAYNPASLADGASATTTLALAGASLGDVVRASFSLDLQGIDLTAWVSAANTVSIKFSNRTGGTLDLANGTIRARLEKPL